MDGDRFEIWVASGFLLGLRVMPVFVFAPPFSLLRVPRPFLVIMSLGFAAVLISAMPEADRLPHVDAAVLMLGGLREFFVGLVPVVVLQLMFGSLYIVGRTIDVQAGFGLALLIDPMTRGQMPLAGTIFAYALAATFFAMGGQFDLLRFFAASLKAVPLGGAIEISGVAALATYATTVSLVALGVGGAAIATLLMCDLVIAMLSRTVPQMNALLLGIQVKVAVMLVVVPLVLGVSGALFVRLVAVALEAMPRFV
ncbi:MAG: flagellar biosynthetic protein FliR [Novosphingobium sp.]